MSKRYFIFRAGDTELTLPVTPESYQVGKGINVEIVNIHELGDAVLTGYGTLATIQINCMFPAKSYKFASASAPEPYIERFEQWVEQGERLRFIVSDTGVNLPVVVENFSYGEQDGTNDVYADIILREVRQLEAIQLTGDDAGRAEPEKESGVTDYLIKPGDCLSVICQKYYGSASADTYNRLAKYNGIKNPHLIYAGNTLKIPQPLP